MDDNRETTTIGGYGVEGGDNEGRVVYRTSVIQATESNDEEYQTSSAVGLPSVPSNQLESKMGADFLCLNIYIHNNYII